MLVSIANLQYQKELIQLIVNYSYIFYELKKMLYILLHYYIILYYVMLY